MQRKKKEASKLTFHITNDLFMNLKHKSLLVEIEENCNQKGSNFPKKINKSVLN